jgi:anti-sigma B factor antagonist
VEFSVRLEIQQAESGSQVRFDLSGEIDIASARELRDAVTSSVAQRQRRLVIINFRDVSFIDSTGIGELVACHRATTITGAALRVEELPPFVRRQLWAAGLMGLFGFPAETATAGRTPDDD